MIVTVIPRVAPMVMTTATVSWKEAMAPTMYDKLKVTTNCVGGKNKYIVHSFVIDSQLKLLQMEGTV